MPSHIVAIGYKGSACFLDVQPAGNQGKRLGFWVGPHKGTFTTLEGEGFQSHIESVHNRKKYFEKGGAGGRKFPSQHWDVVAMCEFYDASISGSLPPDLMYKGTIGGARNANTCAFIARVLKEGYKWKGIKVHAHGVAKWGPLAVLDYAHRIQIALDRHFGRG